MNAMWTKMMCLFTYLQLTIPKEQMYLRWLLHEAVADRAVHERTTDKRLNPFRVHYALDMCSCLRDAVVHFVVPVYYLYPFQFVEIVDLSVV